MRLPRKNVLPFNGKPIIAYSIETARQSNLFSRVIVSTDDAEIAGISLGLGAEVMTRSPDLSGDIVGGTPAVMRRVSAMLECELICCIYPTAPLMRVEDLHVGVAALLDNKHAAFSFSMGTEPPRDAGQWYWGSRYSWQIGLPLVAPYTVMVPIPPERVCDINTREDFDRALGMHAELFCGHDYQVVSSAMPEAVHFRCAKCGHSLPT